MRMSILLFTLLSLSSVLTAQQPTFDGDNAFALLEKQCAFGPRNPGSSGHSECLAWLVDRLEEYSDEVYKQEFTATDPVTGTEHRLTNVMARFGGEGNFPLMLCAHWDSRPRADMDANPENHSKPVLGANDGASGVAVLLEMARILSENPPNRTVMITLFDGEDMGRSRYPEEFALGSKHWAKWPVPEKPVEAILLDMVGDADLEIPKEYFSNKNARSLLSNLYMLADDLGLTTFVDRSGEAVQDDHIALQKIGIQAVDLIDFDYPYWHTVEDTPDKCSAASLRQVGTLIAAFIYGE